MLPFLFQHTAFQTPTYYVLYLLAFLGAVVLAGHRARNLGLSPVRALDLGIVTFCCGVLGARAFHIFFEAPQYYLSHPLRVFYFWQGGFVLYGGILVGVLAGYLFLKWMKEPIGRFADLSAPCLLLGIGIGRGACLAAGCCYGRPTTAAWGLIFTNPSSAAPLGIPLYPTQILEMLFGLLSAFAFSIYYRKRVPSPPGISFAYALIWYSLFRFAIEFLRGDLDRGLYLDGRISTSQMISLATIIGSLIWIAQSKWNYGRKLT